MNLILLFFILGLFILLERYSFLIFLSNREMPAIASKALRYAPVTVLFAIAVPIILRTDGAIDFSLNPKIITAIAAIVISWRTRNIFYTIGGGMLIFWLSRWIMSLFVA